jgi:hypothetical protein
VAAAPGIVVAVEGDEVMSTARRRLDLDRKGDPRMSTLRRIHAGLGLALVTAFAFMAGCASVDADELSDGDASLGEAAGAVEREAGLRCTVSSGFSPTGREWGEIFITRNPGVCKRVRLGGVAPQDFPSCHQRGREELGCQLIVD